MIPLLIGTAVVLLKVSEEFLLLMQLIAQSLAGGECLFEERGLVDDQECRFC
jgi:hypothetical protein